MGNAIPDMPPLKSELGSQDLLFKGALNTLPSSSLLQLNVEPLPMIIY
jgi:hypothetical protein